MNDLFSFPVQLKGVQEKWARDPQLQPLSLSVGKLVEKLAPLLHRSIFYLELSDPKYLRGNSRGGGRGSHFFKNTASGGAPPSVRDGLGQPVTNWVLWAKHTAG